VSAEQVVPELLEPTDAEGPLDGLAGGAALPVAPFSFDAVAGTWWWSPQLFALHGYAPGEVSPSTELLLTHKHPQDRSRTEGTLRGVLATGQPFCCRHRVIDTAGQVRHVLSIGEAVRGDDGKVVAVKGYFVDLTDGLGGVLAEAAWAAEQHRGEPRAVIEQAKGLLVGAYWMPPEAAFELLVWSAERRNLQVRTLAEGLVRTFSGGRGDRQGNLVLEVGVYLDLFDRPEDTSAR
jgi:hypothetical protein